MLFIFPLYTLNKYMQSNTHKDDKIQRKFETWLKRTEAQEKSRIKKIKNYWKNMSEADMKEHIRKSIRSGADNSETKEEITLIHTKTGEMKTMLRSHWVKKMKVGCFDLLKGKILTSKGWKLHKNPYEDY